MMQVHVFTYVGFVILFRNVDSGDTCGALQISEPAIRGRQVNLTFTPVIPPGDGHNISFQRYSPSSQWGDVQVDNNTIKVVQENKRFILYIANTIASDERAYYVKYRSNSTSRLCQTSTVTLDLKVLSDCGYLYLRTPKVRLGGTAEVGYFPEDAVKTFNHDYVLWWMHRDGGIEINNQTIKYENFKAKNDEFVLRIKNVTEADGGQYKVHCTNRSVNQKYTKPVTLQVMVPPGELKLGPKTVISENPEYLYSEYGRESLVACSVHSGTKPLNVNITFGDKKVLTETNADGTEFKTNRYRVKDSDHKSIVNCSVTNDASDEPVSTSAILYVTKPPSKPPELHIPKVFEDGKSVITCSSNETRPAPQLRIETVSGNVTSPQKDEYDEDRKSYTSLLKLLLPLSVNGQKIRCCLSANAFGTRCTKEMSINMTFVPSEVVLQGPVMPKTSQKVYVLNATCSAKRSNPECQFNWEYNKVTLISKYTVNKTGNLVSGYSSSQTVDFNVTLGVTKATITCTVTCGQHEPISRSLDIKLPAEGNGMSAPDRNGDSQNVPIIAGVVGGVVLVAVIVVTTFIFCRTRARKGARVPNSRQDHTTDGVALEEVTYAQIDKSDKLCAASAKSVEARKKDVDPEPNLVYVELDVDHFKVTAPGARAVDARVTEHTEYSGIDFIKTVQLAQEGPEENVYANQ